MLLPDMTLEAASDVAERLRSAIEGLAIPHPGSPIDVVTASIGLAVMGAGIPDNAETLQREAERALYQAKREGRNRVAYTKY